MPTVQIRSYKKTQSDRLARGINYVIKDKIEYIDKNDLKKLEEIEMKRSMGAEIELLNFEKDTYKVIYHTVSSGINCSISNAVEEFQVIGSYNSKGNNIAFHLTQNFDKMYDLELIQKIGKEFMEKAFDGFQVVMATHINKDFIHNHFIINAVSFVDYHKYLDNDTSYAKLRKISDEICLKYGISILEKTKDYKVVNYKDKNGKKRRIEPTERKINIYKNKNGDEAPPYLKYKDEKYINDVKNINRTDQMKQTIDSYIPKCKNFEELVCKLFMDGFYVRSKKKDGSYLKYISYKHKDWKKPLRDSYLGKGYSREEIEERIKEYLISQNKYDYSFKTVAIEDIKNLNINHRIVNGVQTERSAIEKLLLYNSKLYADKVKSKYNSTIKFNYNNNLIPIDKKISAYDMRINNLVASLNYVSRYKVSTISTVSQRVKSLYNMRQSIIYNMSEIKNKLTEIQTLNNMVKAYNLLSVKKGLSVAEISSLNQLKSMLEKYDLLDGNKQETLLHSQREFEDRFIQISSTMKGLNTELVELDKVIRGVGSCYKGIKCKETETVKDYFEFKNSYKKLAQNKANNKANNKDQEKNNKGEVSKKEKSRVVNNEMDI